MPTTSATTVQALDIAHIDAKHLAVGGDVYLYRRPRTRVTSRPHTAHSLLDSTRGRALASAGVAARARGVAGVDA